MQRREEKRAPELADSSFIHLAAWLLLAQLVSAKFLMLRREPHSMAVDSKDPTVVLVSLCSLLTSFPESGCI